MSVADRFYHEHCGFVAPGSPSGATCASAERESCPTCAVRVEKDNDGDPFCPCCGWDSARDQTPIPCEAHPATDDASADPLIKSGPNVSALRATVPVDNADQQQRS